MTKPLTDEQLMVRYQNGDIKAFDEIYNRHSGKIWSFLKKRIKNQEKVEEICQEVFIKIHKSKHLFNPSLTLIPWIFMITKSVMIDSLRKESTLYEKSFDDSLFEPSGEVLNTIDNLSESLSPKQKQALELRYVEGQDFEEIAKILNTSPINARKIISRSVIRLKKIFKGGTRE